MEKKRIINFVLLALGLFSCIFLLIFLSDPSITGMVVYSLSEQTKVWNSDDFIPEDSHCKKCETMEACLMREIKKYL